MHPRVVVLGDGPRTASCWRYVVGLVGVLNVYAVTDTSWTADMLLGLENEAL